MGVVHTQHATTPLRLETRLMEAEGELVEGGGGLPPLMNQLAATLCLMADGGSVEGPSTTMVHGWPLCLRTSGKQRSSLPKGSFHWKERQNL